MAANNCVHLVGRLSHDPDYRPPKDENSKAFAKFIVACGRRKNPQNAENQQTADFISVKAFKQHAEFANKYLHKGTKVVIQGHIETGSYKKNGTMIYTTDVVVDEIEFAESKKASEAYAQSTPTANEDGSYSYGSGSSASFKTAAEFQSIPDGMDEELPFK